MITKFELRGEGARGVGVLLLLVMGVAHRGSEEVVEVAEVLPCS